MTIEKNSDSHTQDFVAQGKRLSVGAEMTYDGNVRLTGGQVAETQSAAAAATATSGTIATASVVVARVSPAAAITGVILAAGTKPGQRVTVVNEAIAANSVTFAASGTSNVADGVSSVIAGLTARTFAWDSVTALWYPCK